MNDLAFVAAVAAAVASSSLALRANMLKPTFGSWCDAPTVVWLSLSVLAVVLAGTAVSIWRGSDVTPRETLVLLALAATSVVMLWNLHRQTGQQRRSEHPPA